MKTHPPPPQWVAGEYPFVIWLDSKPIDTILEGILPMTEAPAKAAVPWDKIVPQFSPRLREPKKPERPSDGAIAMAQRSYDGQVNEDGVTEHAITHRFPTEALADQAEDELKRAGSYTNPVSTVSTVRDPENTGDRRFVRWMAGEKRGRKV